MSANHRSSVPSHKNGPFTTISLLAIGWILILIQSDTSAFQSGFQRTHRRCSYGINTPKQQQDQQQNGRSNGDLQASSLFLDIPDPETLKAAMAVMATGISSGFGLTYMMDRAASGFRRRFFVQKQLTEKNVDPRTIPREYRIYVPSDDDVMIPREEVRRRMLKIRKRKFQFPTFRLPEITIPNPFGDDNEPRLVPVGVGLSSSSAWQSSATSTWQPSAATVSTPRPSPPVVQYVPPPVAPPAPASTTSFPSTSAAADSNTYKSSWSSASSTAPIPTSSSIPGKIATATTATGAKKSYGPSKWSPNNTASPTGYAGGNSYLASMSAPSQTSASSSFGSSGGYSGFSGTSTTTPAFAGGNSYLSSMSNNGSSNTPPPITYGSSPMLKQEPPTTTAAWTTPPTTTTSSSLPSKKKSYGPSKWSPKKTTADSTGKFAGGNSYFGTMSSSSTPPVVSAYNPTSEPLSSAVSSYGSTGSFGAPVPAPLSYTNTVSGPETLVASPASTPVNYMEFLSDGGRTSGTTTGGTKSYSMSKWSPAKTVQASGTGLGGYLASMSAPSFATSPPTSYAPPSPSSSTSSYAPPSWTDNSSGGGSASTTSSWSSLSSSVSGSSATTGTTSTKSYSMSKWSPTKTIPASGTGLGGYLASMSAPSTASSPPTSYAPPSPSSSSASYAPPSWTDNSNGGGSASTTTSWSSLSSSVSGSSATTGTTSTKSYSMSKWSPTKTTPASGTGLGGYLASMSAPSTTSSPPTSYAPASPSTASSSYAAPSWTGNTSSGSAGTANAWSSSSSVPGNVATTESTNKKSYSMSKWSPTKTVQASGTGLGGYIASMSAPVVSPSMPTSYAPPSPSSPFSSYTPQSWTDSSSSGSSSSGSSSSGNSWTSSSVSGNTATTGATTSKKSYTMSNWSPLKTTQATGTGLGGYLASMSTPATAPSAPTSYAPPSPSTSWSGSTTNGWSSSSPSYGVPPPSPSSSYYDNNSPSSPPTFASAAFTNLPSVENDPPLKWSFRTGNGMTGSGTGYFAKLSQPPNGSSGNSWESSSSNSYGSGTNYDTERDNDRYGMATMARPNTQSRWGA